MQRIILSRLSLKKSANPEWVDGPKGEHVDPVLQPTTVLCRCVMWPVVHPPPGPQFNPAENHFNSTLTIFYSVPAGTPLNNHLTTRTSWPDSPKHACFQSRKTCKDDTEEIWTEQFGDALVSSMEWRMEIKRVRFHGSAVSSGAKTCDLKNSSSAEVKHGGESVMMWGLADSTMWSEWEQLLCRELLDSF